MTQSDIEQRLHDLEGWAYNTEGFIHKDYKFKDFVAAFSFMTRLAGTAEKLGHHPDWTNVYNQVTIKLTTHEAHGVTDLDFEFAKQAELTAKSQP